MTTHPWGSLSFSTSKLSLLSRLLPSYPSASQEKVLLPEAHVLNKGMTSMARSEICTGTVLLTICGEEMRAKGRKEGV